LLGYFRYGFSHLEEGLHEFRPIEFKAGSKNKQLEVVHEDLGVDGGDVLPLLGPGERGLDEYDDNEDDNHEDEDQSEGVSDRVRALPAFKSSRPGEAHLAVCTQNTLVS